MPDYETRLTAVEEEVARLRDLVEERAEAAAEDYSNIADMIRMEFKMQDRRIEQRFQKQDRRMDRMEADISELKTDVAGLKTDVAGLKADVASLTSDMSAVLKILTTKLGPI
jgi:predicted RNase H-like nuclease (RuvC/YqgF family)